MVRKISRAEKRKKAAIGIFVSVVMISSILGFVMNQNSTDTYVYKGQKFTRVGNSYLTKIDDVQLTFSFLPQDVESLELSRDSIDAIKNSKMIYLTFDPDQEDLAYIDKIRFDLSNELPILFDTYPVSAVTKNSTNYNLPVKVCGELDPSEQQIPMIYFREGNTTRMELSNNCLVFEASYDQEYLMLKDRLLYGLLGIIE